MRVVIAHNRYSSAQPSGENTVVDAEIDDLSAAGVEVIPFLRSSDEIPDLKPSERLLLPISPIYARRAQRELDDLIVRERPDVVHLHNPYPLLSPWVIKTAHSHGVPVIHTVHNFRQVCVSGLFFRDGQTCTECVGHTWAHPAVKHACYRGSRQQSVIMATALAAHRGTWRAVDRFLALTPVIATHLSSLGIAPEQVTVKPNAVADPGSPARKGDGFLFVGRLSAEKGLNLLLNSWTRHPEMALGRLTIAGDGPLRHEVESWAAARADITYVGRLTPAAVGDAMRTAAVVVVPSTWGEVCSMVVLEALSHGRPVLATNRGGTPWLLGYDQLQPAGWLVEPNIEALASALSSARSEADGLSAVARSRYTRYFSPERVTKQLLDVYREVIAGRPDRDRSPNHL